MADNWKIILAQDEQGKFAALDDWFQTPQGIRISAALMTELEPITAFLHGQRLLQLGSFGQNEWLSSLSYGHKWLTNPVVKDKDVTFLSSMNALPIDRQAVDCVFAPFSLEISSNHRHLINEIDRILAPMGYAIFLGVNPWSFWGMALRICPSRWFARSRVTLCSALTLKRTLLNRGYTQCFLSNFYYIPPFRSEKFIHKLEFLNEMGKMMWPYPASFYCLIAQKYDPAMLSPQFERTGLISVC